MILSVDLFHLMNRVTVNINTMILSSMIRIMIYFDAAETHPAFTILTTAWTGGWWTDLLISVRKYGLCVLFPNGYEF